MTHDEIRSADTIEAQRIARDLLTQNQAVTGQRDAALEQVTLLQEENDRLRDLLELDEE